MNPGFEYYRPWGNPATGVITFHHTPLVGDTVTIAGVAYVFGTDFVGVNRTDAARSLAAVINADRAAVDVNPAGQLNPCRTVFAIFYGHRVTVIATIPGTAANAYALVTSASSRIAVSAATLSGGTDTTIAISGGGTSQCTPSVIVKTVASATTPEALSATATQFQRAIIRGYKAARVKNTDTVWLQLAAADASAGVDIDSGETFELVAPDGKYLLANGIYIDVATAGDGVMALLF